MRFGPVITVNQQVARQPVELAKERDPQQAFLPTVTVGGCTMFEAVTIS